MMKSHVLLLINPVMGSTPTGVKFEQLTINCGEKVN